MVLEAWLTIGDELERCNIKFVPAFPVDKCLFFVAEYNKAYEMCELEPVSRYMSEQRCGRFPDELTDWAKLSIKIRRNLAI